MCPKISQVNGFSELASKFNGFSGLATKLSRFSASFFPEKVDFLKIAKIGIWPF